MECTLNAIELNKFVVAAVGIDLKYASEYNEILWAKKVYGRLWQIRNLLNKTFGLSLLAVSIQSLVELVIYPYWMFAVWELSIKQQSIDQAIWLFFPSIVLVAMLCLACDCCTQKAVQIGYCVRNILMQTNSHGLNGIGSDFILQTIHQPFSITANGICKFDLSLPVSVI